MKILGISLFFLTFIFNKTDEDKLDCILQVQYLKPLFSLVKSWQPNNILCQVNYHEALRLIIEMYSYIQQFPFPRSPASVVICHAANTKSLDKT